MRAKDLRMTELVGLEPTTGFPTFGGVRVLVMGMPTLLRLQEDLVLSLGQEKMAVIFARFGYEAGLGQATAMGGMYDFENPEEWLRAGGVLRKLSGLANEEIGSVEVDRERGVLRFTGVWHDSFEALLWRRQHEPNPTPVCSILTGLASGYASAILGTEVLVRETGCHGAGDDFCTFEGRPVAEWGLDPEEMRNYYAVNDLGEEINRLQNALHQVRSELVRQNAEVQILRRQGGVRRTGSDEHGIIFRSESIAKLLVLAEKVAPTGATVLIQGESGTGKEILARFIHEKSGRGREPFMAVNCAALPPNLLESELFGHVKGSFTGADSDKKGLFVEAGRGTLFLDEVGELPLELQAKILRAIQEKEVRQVGGLKGIPIQARIITATNRDLRAMVAEGTFREDLFYRLAVFPLLVTPLRQRREDILLLARHFLGKFRQEHPGFSPEAVRKLEAYTWPGNVRELENWIEYAVVLAGDERILPEHLPISSPQDAQNPMGNLALDLPSAEELERRYISLVLEHTGGNKSEAARILGLSISTLWRRLKE